MRNEYEEGYLDGVNDFKPQNIHNPKYLEGYQKRCPVEGYDPEELAQYAGNIPNNPQRD